MLGGQQVTGIAFGGAPVNGVMHDGQVIFEDSSDGYVHDGLVARYIAARNMRDSYDPSTLVWRDVVGSADMTMTPAKLTPARRWGTNYFDSLNSGATWFTWAAALPASFDPENCCIETALMPTAMSNGSYGGDVWGINGVATAPYIACDNEMYGANLRLYAPETASYAQTGANQALTLNKLYSTSTLVQPLNGGTGRKQLYISGVRKIDVARTARLHVQRTPSIMNLMGNGGAFPEANQVFYGRLYEVRVYNRALSADEIAQNYARDATIYGIT